MTWNGTLAEMTNSNTNYLNFTISEGSYNRFQFLDSFVVVFGQSKVVLNLLDSPEEGKKTKLFHFFIEIRGINNENESN